MHERGRFKDTRQRDLFHENYTVFNVEQIEGLPDHYYTKPKPLNPAIKREEALESFFASMKADIRHSGNQAYYAQKSDYVQIPPLEYFDNAERYYATLAHEMIHWTSHATRLDRDFARKRWGDEGCAREELVAELGAAFLCAELGITPETRADHAAYIGSWLQVLKDDKRAIFSAAADAQRAADCLLNLHSAIELPEQQAA